MNNASREDMPPPSASSTGLKIIGAGFGRTGTLSLKAALEELGFGPCYHMVELMHHPEHLELWEAAGRGEPINWNDIFADYQATVDWPGCPFYEQLMQAYPQAKVILSVRDPESWYESASSTIFSMRISASRSPLLALLFSIMTTLDPHMRQASRITKGTLWQHMINVDVANKQQAIAFFNQHNATVKERVPVDNLLVYHVKEGWGPVCAFLGVAVPATPFPHLNDREHFPGRQAIRRVQRRLVGAVVAIGVLSVLLMFHHRRSRLRKQGFCLSALAEFERDV